MVKPTRLKTKAVKRTSKRKTADRINMELDDDTDDPEVEVELDSLGSLFMNLVTMIFLRRRQKLARLRT